MAKHQLSSALAVVLTVACERPRSEAPPPITTTSAVSVSTREPPSAHAALDELDRRAPVPLLPLMANHQKQNMRDHLLAVQEVVAAVAINDFSAVERATARLGLSDSMAQTCTHMGMGAPGFTERALEFHRTADRIGLAARQHDQPGVLRALGATLTACTACHAAFKQDVVDSATWHRMSEATRSQTPGSP